MAAYTYTKRRRPRPPRPRPLQPRWHSALDSLLTDISMSGPGYGLPTDRGSVSPAATDISSSGPGYGLLPRPRSTVPVPPVPRRPPAGTAQDPLAAANAYADAMLAPYRDEIRRQQEEALRDAERRAQFERAAAAALAQILGGIAPQIQGIYKEAGADTTAAAKGFSEGLRASVEKSASEANELMGSLANAPDAQKIGGERATGAGDVAYGLGGWIPASTFAREGAAFASAAAFLPNTALGEGARSARGFLEAGAKAKQDLENQWLQTLAQQRPELVQSYLDDAAEQKSGRDSQAYDYAKSVAATFTANSDHVYVPKRDASGAWQVVDAGPKNQPAKRTALRIVRAADGSQIAVDPYTGATVATVSAPGQPKPAAPKLIKGSDGRTYRYNPAANSVVPVSGQPPPKTKTTTGKTLTPGQANALVDQWYAGKPTTRRVLAPEKDTTGNPVYQTRPGPRQGQLGYQQAYRRLLALGTQPAQALQLLNTRYQRGERGRPWISAPQRIALRKAGVKTNAAYLTRPQSKRVIASLPAGVSGDELGFAYLTPAQVDVLQGAGLLPPGQWVPGSGARDSRGRSLVRIYVISAGY